MLDSAPGGFSFFQGVSSGFVALFPLLNPFNKGLVADRYLAGLSTSERRSAAGRIVLNSLLVCTLTLLIGTWLFNFFGLSLPIVQMAGGLLISRAGWKLLTSDIDTDQEEMDPLPRTNIQGMLFYPLAFPMTAGAGTISVLLTLSARDASEPWREHIFEQAALWVAVAGLCSLVYLSLVHTNTFTQRLGPRGKQVLNRLSAFLVFCIGIQILTTALRRLIYG